MALRDRIDTPTPLLVPISGDGEVELEDGVTRPVRDRLAADLPLGYHWLSDRQGPRATCIFNRPALTGTP